MTFENWKRKLVFLAKLKKLMAEDKHKTMERWANQMNHKLAVN